MKKTKKTKMKTFRPSEKQIPIKKKINIEFSVVTINVIAIFMLALSFALFPILQQDTSFLHSPQNIERVNTMRNIQKMRQMNAAPVWNPPAVPMQIWQPSEVKEPKQIRPFE